MIYSVRGNILLTTPNYVVVESGGVGFQCYCSLSTLQRLPASGREVLLYTYLNVREDAMELFGFLDEQERECFLMLTSVSGVGPKVGLAILSVLSPDRVALAIVGGDAKALTQAAGVGPKLAQRIVLELRDKLKGADFAVQPTGGNVLSIGKGNTAEAIAALSALGYSQSEAASMISRLDPELSTEELVKSALKLLAAKQR